MRRGQESSRRSSGTSSCTSSNGGSTARSRSSPATSASTSAPPPAAPLGRVLRHLLRSRSPRAQRLLTAPFSAYAVRVTWHGFPETLTAKRGGAGLWYGRASPSLPPVCPHVPGGRDVRAPGRIPLVRNPYVFRRAGVAVRTLRRERWEDPRSASARCWSARWSRARSGTSSAPRSARDGRRGPAPTTMPVTGHANDGRRSGRAARLGANNRRTAGARRR